jgi:hypothetical protein
MTILLGQLNLPFIEPTSRISINKLKKSFLLNFWKTIQKPPRNSLASIQPDVWL